MANLDITHNYYHQINTKYMQVTITKILFLIFVNGLPATVTSSLVLMFTDDAKCAHSIFKLSDCLSLQEDLNNIVSWSTTWNLLFNEGKCSVVRFSPSLRLLS